MTYVVQDHRGNLLYVGQYLDIAHTIAIERETYYVQYWKNGVQTENKYVYDLDFAL